MKNNKITAIAVSGLLLATFALTAYAVSPIIKEMNLFQRAAVNGESISEVDVAGDFRYTNLETAEKDEEISSSKKIAAESFTNQKTDIYNKMLNTIDYINKVSIVAKTNMLGAEESELEFNVDIDSGVSYQAVTEGKTLVSETYSNIEAGMVSVNNAERSYTENYLPVYTREDTPYIALSDRIETGEDGIPVYTYRRNITNCPLASYCLVPQEITFSYLKDFDMWKIADASEEYLGRDCVVIMGKPSAYIETKHGIDSFEMIVDKETGIMLNFEGTQGEELVRYMEVTDMEFGTRSAVKLFDSNEYADYDVVKRP